MKKYGIIILALLIVAICIGCSAKGSDDTAGKTDKNGNPVSVSEEVVTDENGNVVSTKNSGKETTTKKGKSSTGKESNTLATVDGGYEAETVTIDSSGKTSTTKKKNATTTKKADGTTKKQSYTTPIIPIT